jgi:hypothetical protein
LTPLAFSIVKRQPPGGRVVSKSNFSTGLMVGAVSTASSIVGLALLAMADNCIAAGATPVAGVWRFEHEVDRRGDGSLVNVGPAQDYEGMLILTPDGFVSGTMLPRGRKWTVGGASLAELRETIEMGTATSGSYTVDPTTQTLVIQVVTALDPEDVGKSLSRHYSLTGEVLSLSGTWAYQGETLTFTIDFRRIK